MSGGEGLGSEGSLRNRGGVFERLVGDTLWMLGYNYNCTVPGADRQYRHSFWVQGDKTVPAITLHSHEGRMDPNQTIVIKAGRSETLAALVARTEMQRAGWRIGDRIRNYRLGLI